MSSRVEIYINLPGLANAIAGNISQTLAGEVTRLARQKVRKDTKILMTSIRNIGISRYRYFVISDLPYSAAQEWGLAKFGKPNYGFTPYMGPSASEVMQTSVFKPLAEKAINGAIEKQRRRS